MLSPKHAFLNLLALLCSAGIAWADEPPATAAPAAPAPKTYALISAVGDQLEFVTRKMGTGSNMLDTFYRKKVKIDNNALNTSVLRGLDRVLDASAPGSKRVYMSLAPAQLEGVLPQDREMAAINKVIKTLEKNPQRMEWDKIIVVTPAFRSNEFSGMGTKLYGLGVFVQPLYSGKMPSDGGDIDLDSPGDGNEVTTPDKQATRSRRYVAPYSYTQLWVLDAKTLQILEKNDRYDNQKLFDPKSTAINVADAISTEFLATQVVELTERSAAKSLSGTAVGTSVEIGEIRPVKDQPAKK